MWSPSKFITHSSPPTNVTFLKYGSDCVTCQLKILVSHWSLQNDSSYLSPHDLVPLQFPVFFHLYSLWLCPEGPSSIPSSLTLRRIPLRDTLLTASVQIRWRFWDWTPCAPPPRTASMYYPPPRAPGSLSTLLLPPWGALPIALWD